MTTNVVMGTIVHFLDCLRIINFGNHEKQVCRFTCSPIQNLHKTLTRSWLSLVTALRLLCARFSRSASVASVSRERFRVTDGGVRPLACSLRGSKTATSVIIISALHGDTLGGMLRYCAPLFFFSNDPPQRQKTNTNDKRLKANTVCSTKSTHCTISTHLNLAPGK